MADMNMVALVNGTVITPSQALQGKAVIVEEGRIAGIEAAGGLPAGIETVDVGGRYIAPGLIDIHTHGAVGRSFNQGTHEAFSAITQQHVQRGITSILATTSSAPIPVLVRSLRTARELRDTVTEGSQVLGVHVEGPYFSMEQRGAQDPANIRQPDDGTVDELLNESDVIKILTYAPELPGGLDLTRRLVSLGILPAAGHSSSREEDVRPAIKLGLSHIIHIWSGQSTTIREGPWRKPGLLEVTLASDDLTVEMISDNRHLPPTLMKLAYKCIGPDRLSIISDATAGAGLPDGTRFKMNDVEHEVSNGVGVMLDRSAFAGSTTFVNQMVRIVMEHVGVPLVEAVRMASLTPARTIGVDDVKGSIEVGKHADIAVFNSDFTAWRTMVRGHWVGAH